MVEVWEIAWALLRIFWLCAITLFCYKTFYFKVLCIRGVWPFIWILGGVAPICIVSIKRVKNFFAYDDFLLA